MQQHHFHPTYYFRGFTATFATTTFVLKGLFIFSRVFGGLRRPLRHQHFFSHFGGLTAAFATTTFVQ